VSAWVACAAAQAWAPEAPAQLEGAAAPAAVTAAAAAAQDEPYEGRMVARIEFEGLERASDRYVRNQLRTFEGRPLSWDVVREDVRRLERLGEFERVGAEVLPRDDGTVVVTFRLSEAPIIQDIVVVGNRNINDEEIARIVNQNVSLIAGVPIDEYRIGQAQRAIEELYRDRGFYRVEVTVDRSELDSQGVVLFRVREGDRTQVTALRFEGNDSIPAKRLRAEVDTKKRVLFFNAPLEDLTLDRDVASIIEIYRNEGFLDVRAARDVRLSPNGKEAIVTFLIEEGPRYTLRRVLVEGPEGPEGAGLEVFSPDQLRGLFTLKPGDIYRENAVGNAVEAVRSSYLKIGYVDARVGRSELRAIDSPQVDVLVRVVEGERFRAGLVLVQGNELTQAKIIRRRVDIRPGEWLDGSAAEETERRLRASGLFELNPVAGDPPKVTVLPEDPAQPGYRDVLVEVQETNTGSLTFGASVDSDFGLVGAIRLSQRNFDIADFPDSFDELIKGRAFRGAGQTFNLALQPGVDTSTYSLSITEPALFETEYGATFTGFFRQQAFRDYDEERFGTRVRLGRRFGTRWVGGFAVRAESIELSNIDPNQAVDVFEVEDQNILTAVSFDLARTTADSRFRPTRGTRTDFRVDQYGLIGGDFDFTRLNAEHSVFLTIDRDDFDRPTVLTLSGRVGLIPQDDESPVYERFYLGGRSFRGFEFRGIGPVGIRADTGEPGRDQVGGDFVFFLGAEVQKPIWEDLMAIVGFIDSGTLNNAITLSNYRVSVGVGIRLYLPQFGQAPLAFDFGFPLAKEETDREQLFSFAIDIPF
jgi:outer membrane protein insertion porin family